MFILLDIGGTKIRCARSNDCREFTGEPVVISTPQNMHEGVAAIREAVEQLAGDDTVAGVAGGIAGVFSDDGRSLTASPNLPRWVGEPLISELESAMNVPVTLKNDATVVGLGEMHYGAGSPEGVGAYITVSTGMGGARFVDGSIDAATYGFEVGKQIIDADGTVCPDCTGPLLEQYISGGATQKRLGKKAYEIEDPKLWEAYAHALAYGLTNTIVHWSPKSVVVGGSMIVGAHGPTISLRRTAEHLEKLLTIYPKVPELREAALGDYGGLYGAMVLLRT